MYHRERSEIASNVTGQALASAAPTIDDLFADESPPLALLTENPSSPKSRASRAIYFIETGHAYEREHFWRHTPVL